MVGLDGARGQPRRKRASLQLRPLLLRAHAIPLRRRHSRFNVRMQRMKGKESGLVAALQLRPSCCARQPLPQRHTNAAQALCLKLR